MSLQLPIRRTYLGILSTDRAKIKGQKKTLMDEVTRSIRQRDRTSGWRRLNFRLVFRCWWEICRTKSYKTYTKPFCCWISWLAKSGCACSTFGCVSKVTDSLVFDPDVNHFTYKTQMELLTSWLSMWTAKWARNRRETLKRKIGLQKQMQVVLMVFDHLIQHHKVLYDKCKARSKCHSRQKKKDYP